MLLAQALTALEAAGTPDLATSTPPQLLAEDPWEWRALWMDGLAAMKQEDWERREGGVQRGLPAGARRARRPSWRSRSRASAAGCRRSPRASTPPAPPPTRRTSRPPSFGMARVRALRRDTAGAVAALDQVPSTSRGYPESRQLRADVLLAGSGSDLARARPGDAAASSRCRWTRTTRQRYTVRILQQALDVGAGRATRQASNVKIGGVRRHRGGAARGLEQRLPSARPRRARPRRPGRAGQPGQRRTQLDADMSETTDSCPSLRRQVAAATRSSARAAASRSARRRPTPAAPLPRRPPGRRPRQRPDQRADPRRRGDRPAAPTVGRGRRPCVSCGGDVGPDGYCEKCGAKAPSERDHFREQPAPWVAGVCDRGIRHTRNEDAMALLASDDAGAERAVLVVLDGVSNTDDSARSRRWPAPRRRARCCARRSRTGWARPRAVRRRVTKVFADAVDGRQRRRSSGTTPEGSTSPAVGDLRRRGRRGRDCCRTPTSATRAPTGCPTARRACSSRVDDSAAQQQIEAGDDRARRPRPGRRRTRSPAGSAGTRPTSRRGWGS